MKIGIIAPLAEAIPPPLYGGTERVVHVLTEELVRRGHDVTLFASGDSRTTARLEPCSRTALRLDPLAADGVAPVVTMLARVAELADRFDVIHNHTDYLAFPFARHWQPPTLTTLHGRLDLPELPALYERFPEVNLVSISESQRQPLARLGLRWVRTVPNGIQVERFTFRAKGGDYLVFLGRISPEKRPDLAVAVARRTGLPLKIAAKIDDVDRAWHEAHMARLLDDPLVEYVGEVDEGGKDALLGGAAALLFPSRWPEPFGLVMIEAMACGTPVIALRYGAVPEVVAHGETGFVCDSIDEMVAAVGRLGELDRAACRRRVETLFSAQAMTDGYEQAYVALLNDARPLPILAGALIAGQPVAAVHGAPEGEVG